MILHPKPGQVKAAIDMFKRPRPVDPITECELAELRQQYDMMSSAYSDSCEDRERLRKQNQALNDLAVEWGKQKAEAELRAHVAELKLKLARAS